MKAYRYSILAVLLLALFATTLSAQPITFTDISTTPTTCATGTDGTITFTFTGGVAPFEWYIYEGGGAPVDFGGPTTDTTITSFGRRKFASHILIVKDINENAAAAIVAVDGPEVISITFFASTDITCNNNDDGTITVSATGESGAFFFDLAGPVTTTNTTGNFTGLPGGDYTVTVRDQGTCTTTDVTPTLTINNPTLVSATLDNITDVLCYGESTGSIAITPTGGTPSGPGTGYTYFWTGPSGYTSTSEDILNLEAGDYFVTITDGNGCSSNLGPFTVGQPTQIIVNLDGSSDVLCNGGNDGTAAISVSGGAGGYLFSWTGQVNGLVSTDEDPVNLPADTYDLTVVDADGCTRTFTSFLTINEPPPLSVTVDVVSDVNCNGGTDGFVMITPSGGTPAYSFLWTGASSGYSSTDEDPTGMPADIYSLTISDANGCVRVYTDLLTINEPSALVLSLDGSTDVTCNGGNDGSATITVSGGNPPYVFSWVGAIYGPVSSDQNPTDLQADTYSLFILDNNGCFISAFNFVTINEPSNLAVTVDLVTNVVCNGESTGAIEITPSGGTPGYLFAWTGPNGFTASTEDIINVPAGTYSLTITDASGCSRDFTDLATVVENPPITATFSITDLNCGYPVPSNDGAIDVTVTGGVGPYAYSWTGPFGFTSAAEDLTGLLSGDYVLEVTDNLGCVMTFPAQTVGIPPQLTASTTQVNIVCFGAADGLIDLTVAGGTPPYFFAWTGPNGFTASTEDISNLEAGAYSVTVTDSHGCPVTFTDVAIITEVPQIQVSATSTDLACNGGSDGTINISYSGGTLPFAFAWTGPNGFTASTEDLSGLAAGAYSLTITDANGCVASFIDLVTLTEPGPITVSIILQHVLTCFDSPEGSIAASGAGGTGTILYSLDGSVPDISGNFTNLTAGFHTLTLIDQNSCTLDSTLEILAPPQLLIDNIVIGDVTGCAGDSNGSLEVMASGGTGALEYSLDSVVFQASNLFTLLPAGTDTVYVKDANGCTVSDTATIQEPEAVFAVVTKTDSSFVAPGSITISGATGGAPPYAYSINGPGGPFTSNTVYTGLSLGTYHVVVRDQNGCTYEEMVDILEILPLDVILDVTPPSCFGADDGSILFMPQDAEGPVQYSIDNGATYQSDPLFTGLAGSRTYQLVAEDSVGKLFIDVIYMTQPTRISFNNSSTLAECNAFSPTGSIDLNVSGGAGNYTYLWSDGDTTEDRSNLLAGVYHVVVTDSDNCSRSVDIAVNSIVVVEAHAGEDALMCPEGSLQLQASGTGSPLWDPSPYLSDETVPDPIVSGITAPTTFVVTYSESISPYGCHNIDSVTIGLQAPVGLEAGPDTSVISGASVRLQATGGSFTDYLWEPDTWLDINTVANPLATPLESIRYRVTATNEFGCTETDSMYIEVIEGIHVYNVFSPNGDGINEYFEIENAERYPEILVEVYSRWGDLFFSSVGYDSSKRWDGRTRGTEAPVGTYYYIIIPEPGAKPITGHVTIIR